MLALAVAALVPSSSTKAHPRASVLMIHALRGTKSAAKVQMEAYFEMAPWEKPITIAGWRGAKSTDLRALMSFDRSRAVVVPVYATQEGLPPVGVYSGDLQKALLRGDAQLWRVIGCISAPDEGSLSLAVARQRRLIEAWACELIRDRKTDKKLFRQGPTSPPIRLAWAHPPSTLQKMFKKGYLGEMQEVSPDAKVVDVQCGFVGSQTRTQRSSLDDPSKGGYHFVPIELPDV